MEKFRCPYCGHTQDTDGICRNCDYARVVMINDVPRFIRGARYRCDTCGRRLPSYFEVCPKCGKGKIVVKYRNSRKKKSGPFIAAVLLAAVILLAVFREPLSAVVGPFLRDRFPGAYAAVAGVFRQQNRRLSTVSYAGGASLDYYKGKTSTDSTNADSPITDLGGWIEKKAGATYFAAQLKNTSDRTMSFVEIDGFYDRNGEIVMMAFSLIEDLEPGKETEYRVEIDGEDAKRIQSFRGMYCETDEDRVLLVPSICQFRVDDVLYDMVCVYNGFAKPYSGTVNGVFLDSRKSPLHTVQIEADCIAPESIRVYRLMTHEEFNISECCFVRYHDSTP